MTPIRRARDLNFEVAGALYDLALVHPVEYARVAYRRAARAVLWLEEPVDRVARQGRLREVPNIGPSTERIVVEHLDRGASPTVESAIERSPRRVDVEAARALRRGFLSRAEVLRVLQARGTGVVALDDYRGDLQMHTLDSDGGESVEAMADAAAARGHEYLNVTDHSYGLAIAGGMSMEEAARQHAEIDRLNDLRRGRFRIFKGIEANIRPDGSVDMTEDELARFEIVVAAPHSILRRSHDQTDRMIAAVRHPGVHVIGHPRGRMMSRQGVLARWDLVFEEAARRDVAIELDGDWYRQDLDHELARQALAAGCRFALDSDAHSGRELVYSEFAIAHARLAGIPRDRVINTWPAARLDDWARSRKAAHPRRSRTASPGRQPHA
jgi:histidinol phosphatase-like PHP family hydrolase